MRRPLAHLLLFVFLMSLFATPAGAVRAATFRNYIAQVPEMPTSQQTVRVWMQSDTAFGETAGLEYNVGSSYVKVLGTFDTSGPAPANWRADIPAQPNGTLVRYQLFTRNQSGSDYGFTGFNWSYTVNDGDIQWFGLKHDSFDSYYRSPFGAVPAGTNVTLRFRTFPLDVSSVAVRVYRYDPATNTTTGPVEYPMAYLEDRVEEGVNHAIWTATLATPASPAILYYKFRITDRLDEDWYSDSYADDHDNLNQGGLGAVSDNEPFPSFQISVYDPAFVTPDWLKNAVVYQIFPDRFRNGDPTNDYCVDGSTSGCPTFYGSLPVVARTTWNDAIYDPRQPGPYANTYGTQFYGGDLKGIQDKLNYLQSLGVTALYLTPIFEGRSNHRYDTDNYLKIDPALGTQEDFNALVKDMERRGMTLILDGVFNHTSSDSLYFDRYNRYAEAGACETLGSLYRSWYAFYNNNVPCGSSDYAGWFGYDSLAVLTDNSAAVRDFIYRSGGENVIKFWYDRGVSGWRFDVADEITHDWWREFRTYSKGYQPNAPLIGEVWHDASKFLLGEQLDSVMNYRFRKNVLGFARGSAQWNDNDNNGSNNIVALAPSQFDAAMRSIREDYPPQAHAAMLNLLDSHDTNRALYVLTLLGDNGLTEAKQRLQLAALVQFTSLGAPMIYYGDEAGIDSPSVANGPNGPEDDPYNRAPYPWADASGNPDIYGPADADLVAFYSKLAHLRHEQAALRTGDVVTLLTGDTTPSGSDNTTYAFARSAGGQAVVVALNNGSAANSAQIPVSSYFADGTQLQDALSGATFTVSGGAVSVPVAARSGLILLPAPASADVTAPVAAISLSPALNTDGWANSAVTASLSGSDTGAGVKELRYWVGNEDATVTLGSSASREFSAEGSYALRLYAVDRALNVSALASSEIKIDLTPPVVTLQGVTQGAVYTLGSVPAATCQTSDARSGVKTPATASVSGGNPDGTGAFTATCSGAQDVAGNSANPVSVSYTVNALVQSFTFSGFFHPVDNPPVVNAVKAGSAVPIKFSLGGDFGLNIFAPGAPGSQKVSCTGSAPIDSIEQTVNAGVSSLSYNPLTQQYTYVWKTEKAWANTCRQFALTLSDGTVRTANFTFSR